MTIGELSRYVESRKRVQKVEAQEKATFDYTLADLIGRSVARVHSSANHMPEIYEAYPTLFDSNEVKEQRAQKQAELSALRFKQFAASYNDRFKGGSKNK